MLEGELRDAFGDLFNTVGRDKLIPARLGVKRSASTVEVIVPGNPKELYITLGINGEDGQGTAIDGVGVDISFGWQEIRVRRELNKWVIYRATHYGAGSGGGPTTLDELTDVDTAGATDGDLLSYDSSTGEWIPFTPTGTTGTAPSPHALFGEHHTAAPLDDSQGPQFLLIDGSRDLEGNLNVLPTVMIDGVDISDHAIGNPNAHHDAATAGNTGITVSASPTQLVSLNLEDTAPGLQIDATGVRVKNFNGIERTSSGIGILIKPLVTALKVDGTGLYLDNSLAGTGLSIDTNTKVLTVNPGDGLKLDIPNDDVEVDKAHNFIWTGTHRFDALTTFNNNAHFMGAARSVTSDSALNLTPSGDLFLAPIANVPLTRQVKVRNNIPINSENFQDLVTGIDGLHFWQPTDGVNQWQLNINAIKVDQLFVRVFTVDETRLARGQEYWSKSFGIVETSFNLPADEATVDVWFEDVPDLPIEAPLFDAGDWLMIRTIDMAAGYLAIAVWFTVVDGDATGTNDWILREDAVAPTATSNGHGPRQKWRLKRENGGATGLLIRKGVVVLDAGTVGTAWIHLNALTGNLGSSGPYIQMGLMDSIAASDVPVHKNRIRMGNLKDVAGFSSTVYGMAAGNDLSMDPDDGLFTGFTIEDVSGLRLYNTDITIYKSGIPYLIFDRAQGITLTQDIALNDDDRTAITWRDSAASPGGIKAYITNYRTVTTDSVLLVNASSATVGATARLTLQASSTASIATIDLTGNPAIGTGQLVLTASQINAYGRFMVGFNSAAPDPVAVLHVWEQTSANDQTAGLLIQNNSGSGDAIAHFYVSAAPTRYYTMGIDISDGRKFKISNGPTLGASGGTVDFFVYDPVTNMVTLSGLTGGGGGGGTPTVLSGDGIAVSGGGPYTVAVNSSVARDTWDIIAGAGLTDGGPLSSVGVTLSVDPGAGIGLTGNKVVVALASNSGLNTASGLQLDATVAGDGLEFVGVTRVMQASLGNGLVFTGTTPARDITIKLRTLSPGSGLGVTTDGLFIQRRNSSPNDSGIAMTTTDGIYLADTVAGDGLEWTTSSERIMQVSLGVGLEFTGTTPARDIRIDLAALGSGMLVDSTGLRLNPLVAGAGLEYIYLTGTGVLRILAGPGITVGGNDVAIDLGTNPGLSTSSGLYVLLPASGSGLVRDSTGLHLNSTVAGDGLIYDTATGEINVVPLNASLIVRASDMYVNLAHNWLWTGNHTFSTGIFQVNSVAQFNNNINFVSARTITSSGNLTVNPTGNLTFTPTGELVLNPAGTVTLFTAKTFATSSHTDTPTAITGMWVYDRGANEYHMNITSLKMDELHTRVFVADEVRVDRGEEYWSKSFGIVEEEFTLPNVGTTRDVWFENSPALSEIAPDLFSVGDWLLMRTVDTATGMLIRKIWFTVISLVTAGTAANKRQQWRLEKMTGGAGTTGRVRKGTFMLDAGQVGQGWVHLLAYKEMGGPYIQVGDFGYVSGGTTPVFTNRVRMGNLNGVAGITGTFWGFAAGNDLSESPLSGNFSGFTVGKGIGLPGTNYDGLRLYNTDINMYEGGDKIISLNADTGLSFLHAEGSSYTIERALAWVTDVDNPNITTGRYSVIGSFHHNGITDNILRIRSQSDSSTAQLLIEVNGSNGVSTINMFGGTITLDPEFYLVSNADNFSISTAGAVVASSTIQSNVRLDAPVVRAISSAGLRLEDDGGNLGVFVDDGGAVGIGRTPGAGIQLHVNGITMTPTIQGTTASNGDITIEGTSSATKTTSHVLLQPTGGLVGVGTLTPITQFSVSADGASSNIMAASYGATFVAGLVLYSANGTEAVPLPTVSGDLIGQIVFQGWDTARSTGASIRATASANWGTAGDAFDSPTKLSFWTVPDGESVQEERFTILSNGNIGVNQPAPTFRLDVAGTLNATGAVTFGSSLAIAGALSGVTTLAMAGALTGVTTLTATTITANTSLITNTISARTSIGLSLTDDGSTFGVFIDDGGGVSVGTNFVPTGVQLYVAGLGVIRASTDVRTPLLRAVDSTGLNIQDDGGNGITIADGGAVTVSNSLTATTLLISNVVRARTTSGLRLEDSAGLLGFFVEEGGFVGINQTNPTYPLHISDTRGAGTGSIVFGANVSSSYTLVFGLDDTGFKMGHNSSSRNLEFQTASLTRFTIGGTGNVGIGATTLTPRVHIQDVVGSLEHLWLTSFGDNAPTLNMRRPGVSSAAVVASTDIANIAGSGRYNSTSFGVGAFMRFTTSETWSSGARGTEIFFGVTPNGSNTAVNAFRITQAGVLISTGTYNSTSALAKRPVYADVNGVIVTQAGDFALSTRSEVLFESVDTIANALAIQISFTRASATTAVKGFWATLSMGGVIGTTGYAGTCRFFVQGRDNTAIFYCAGPSNLNITVTVIAQTSTNLTLKFRITGTTGTTWTEFQCGVVADTPIQSGWTISGGQVG